MSSMIQEQEFDKKVDIGIWKKLFRFALTYKKELILTILIMAVVSACDILYPLLSRYAIDNFVTEGSIGGLKYFALVYLAVVLVQGGCVFLFVTLAGKLEAYISYDIRKKAFRKLQELSFSFYDKTTVGYLMARMVSDVSRLSEMIAWSVVDLFWAATNIVGILVILLVLNWKLALIVMVVIPPLALLCIYFQKRILKHQRIVRKTNSRITSSFNEGIMGAMTTKTLVREERNTAEFTELTQEMRGASVKSSVLSYVFMPLVMMLGSVGTALALYFGGSAVLEEGVRLGISIGVISFGTLSAFVSYTTAFFDPIQSLARIFAEFQSAQASAERIISLIDTPCDIVDSDEVIAKYGDSFEPHTENWEELTGKIDFENVSFSYKEGETVLKDFDLNIRAGETIALVGETGAGKSTIVNLICRFYEPTAGRILIDGVDYRERSQLWLQKSLGYVLQQPHLFSGTIKDNIAYAKRDATMEEIEAAARMVHADTFIKKQEKGYYTEVGEGGVRLSTGEKQLISFARVLLANPKIFVLDEATSSIDTETEQLIQDAITKVLQNRTSLIVAHRLSTIKNADRILVIRGGKIAEEGTHGELLRQKGYYYNLYTTQFREEASSSILSK